MPLHKRNDFRRLDAAEHGAEEHLASRAQVILINNRLRTLKVFNARNNELDGISTTKQLIIARKHLSGHPR